jgi:hypothetical protein
MGNVRSNFIIPVKFFLKMGKKKSGNRSVILRAHVVRVSVCAHAHPFLIMLLSAFL